MRSHSMLARLTSSLTLSALFFALAIGLWAYQSDRLATTADVVQTGNRVRMNFDELPEGVITPLARQYQTYGVRFTAEPVTLGDVPLVVTNWIPLTSSRPNALLGNYHDANGAHPDPSRPITFAFVDPANPTEGATTDSVRFLLSVDLNQYGLPNGDRGSVRVSAYGPDSAVRATRTITTTGTHTVELQTADISHVVVEGIRYSGFGSAAPPIFALDDLEFVMPGSSAVAAMAATSQRPSYAPGETVTLTYINTGTATLACATPVLLTISGGGAGVGTGAPGQVVYRQEAGTTSDPLTANATRTVTWDQTANTGGATGQVATGTYNAQVTCGTTTAGVSFAIATPPPSGLQATLTMSQTGYQPGETVSFTLTNTGTETITCTSGAPWVIKDGSGNLVFEPISTRAVETLTTGQSRAYSWNQRTRADVPVPSGSYVVTVRCNDIERSASFTIADGGGTDLNFTVTPDHGVVPLLVTAVHELPIGMPPPQTIDFDDLADNTHPSTEYQERYGVTISAQSGLPLVVGPTVPSAVCEGGLTEAASQPRFLAPSSQGAYGYGDVSFSFSEPKKLPGLTLVSVGRATVTVTFYGTDNQVVDTQTVGGRSDDPNGVCRKDQLSYTGTTAISKVTVASDEPAGGTDGIGVDDLIFFPNFPDAPRLTWDFGDGTVIANGPPTQTHVYPAVGTFTVTLRTSEGRSGTRTVTVTAPTPTPTPTPTLTTQSPTPTVTLTSATPTPTPTPTSGPVITPVSGTTQSPLKLVATGGSLAFNLTIAAVLSLLTTYLFLRRRPSEG